MKKAKQRILIDAHESNAGSDFHILWAVQKCLELLNFKADGLKSIVIESLDKEDAAEIDPNSGALLGIDLTEYYSSTNLKEASKINICQLKYSTKHSSKEWTAFSVSAGKKGVKGSIVHRLATTFTSLVEVHGLPTILKKTTIKLISNRPASPLLSELVSKAKLLLVSNSTNATVSLLKKKLKIADYKAMDKLQLASGLQSKTFILFLSLLDFSDCNSNSRYILKQNSFKSLTDLGAFDARDQVAILEKLVRDKTLPDAKSTNRITKEDVLIHFKFPDLESMFPVPPNFEKLTQTVPRLQIEEIKKQIIGVVGKNLICLHGVAGIGKSTTAKQIATLLPNMSETILFDCYGGGTYLNSNDKRHLHQNALLFLSNELALKTGSPFLLNRSGDKNFYLREFSRRLVLASRILLNRDPLAILCIVIDAADNSVTAAEEQHEETFVHDLVKMDFPNNVRLILTSRSHRIDSLQLPAKHLPLILNPFSTEECRIYLDYRFPKTSFSDVQVIEFNTLTKGIPRVMTFTLESPGRTLKEKLRPLKPGGKNLDDIFGSLLEVAEKKSGDRKLFQKVIRHAISLPRPVPIKYLAHTSGASISFVKDITYDLSKGIAIENDLIRFNNEDFETFLRDQYPSEVIDLTSIANYFKSLANKEEYASTYLGRFLASSGKMDELESIVLNRQFIALPADPVRNREVFIERARLAMKNTATTSNSLNYLKLQIVAAEASKANSVIESTMLNKPELSLAFGNGQANMQFYFTEGNPHWYGRVHLRSAAIFSRNAATHDLAKKHLRNAEAWIDFRRSLPEHKLREYDIDDQDLACGTEAILRIVGPANAIRWLQRWKPKNLIYFTIQPLIKNLLATSSVRQFYKWFQLIELRIDVSLHINHICFENGYEPPFDIEELSKRAIKYFRIRQKLKLPLWESLISLVEQLSKRNYSLGRIKKLLKLFDLKTPNEAPSFYTNTFNDENRLQKTDVFFRAVTMRAVVFNKQIVVEDLLPENLKKIDTKLKYEDRQYKEQERRKFVAYYKHLLPTYSLLARTYTGILSRKTIIEELTKILSSYGNDFDLSYYYRYESQHMTNFLSVKLLDFVYQVKDPDEVITIIEEKLQSNKVDNINLLLSMAERLSLSKKLVVPTLRLLELADGKIINGTLSASNQIDYYTRAAIVGSRITLDSGKYYFDKLIEASKDIDLEAFEQIKAVNKIVSKATHINDPKLAYNFSRFVEFCSVKLDGYEDFPWNDAFDAIGKIDAVSVLAVSCRWDHRNIRKFSWHYPKLLQPLIEQNGLSYKTAAALLPITTAYWEDYVATIRTMLKQYSVKAKAEEKTVFLADLIADIKIHYDFLQKRNMVSKILKAFDDFGFSKNKHVVELKAYCFNLDELLTRKVEKEDARFSSEPSTASSMNFKDVNVTDPDSIENFFIKNSKRVLKEDDDYHFNLYRGFDEMFSVIKPNQYVAHLNALIALPVKLVDFWAFEHALEKRLKEWSIYPEIKKWKKENFGKIVRSRFFSYVQLDNYYVDASIFKLAELCDANESEISKVIIESLPDNVNHLSASALLRLLEITTLQLSNLEKIEFLNWLIPRWTEPIKPEFGDGIFQESIIPPPKNNLAVARFLRYHLGHPDKRCRWRAAKAVLRIVEYGELEVFDFLFKEQNEQTCSQFQDSSNTFYWIAAKQWLWIAIHKLSVIKPSAIKNYGKAFLSEFSPPVIQHAQILYFAKAACQQLNISFPDLYSDSEKEGINLMLTNTLTPVKNKKEKKRNRSHSNSLRFEFDPLDTIDYWFEPLGARFQMTGGEIAELVDNVICDGWGVSGNIREQNHVVSNEDGMTSHYKHDIPIIEDLRTYYEYNGMHCVAAMLIKTKPLIEDADHWSTWEEWLNGFGLIWNNLWLSDLKDPIPPEPAFWTERSTRDQWQWNIQAKDLDNLIGFSDYIKKDFINVCSHATIHYGKDYESQSVSSALVEPRYGMSALRAMQTGERHNFYIPLEKEVDSEDDEMDEKHPFRLIPWIQSIGSEHSGVDEFDPEVYQLSKQRYIVGSSFSKWGNTKFSLDKRFAAMNEDFSNPVSVLESWSNVPRKSSYSDFYSYGQRLFIRSDSLLQFLSDSNLALIMSSEMYRSPETKEYDATLSYYNMLYLIFPDGTVKTISRDFRLR